MHKLTFKSFFLSGIIELISIALIFCTAVCIYGFHLRNTRLILVFFSIGISSVILFNLLQIVKYKFYFLIMLIITALLVMILHKNTTLLNTAHHIAKVISLGFIILILKGILPEKKSGTDLVINLLFWVLGYILFFLIYFLVTGMILKFWHDYNKISIINMVITALKVGPVLGLGMGIGNIVAIKLLKQN